MLAHKIFIEDVHQDIEAELKTLSPDNILYNPVESATSSTDWWPQTVKLTTQVSSYSGSRYARHAMWWNTTDLTTLKSFGTRTTYEPDTVYNNYDDQLYLGTTIYYWSSNHSSVYLDTEAFDNGNERVLTVGFYDVQGLSANIEYYTYVRTNYGNHTSDTGKANGQRGHRLWNSCTSRWCVFGDETKFLNPSAWNHSVPGTTWGYN